MNNHIAGNVVDPITDQLCWAGFEDVVVSASTNWNDMYNVQLVIEGYVGLPETIETVDGLDSVLDRVLEDEDLVDSIIAESTEVFCQNIEGEISPPETRFAIPSFGQYKDGRKSIDTYRFFSYMEIELCDESYIHFD